MEPINKAAQATAFFPAPCERSQKLLKTIPKDVVLLIFEYFSFQELHQLKATHNWRLWAMERQIAILNHKREPIEWQFPTWKIARVIEWILSNPYKDSLTSIGFRAKDFGVQDLCRLKSLTAIKSLAINKSTLGGNDLIHLEDFENLQELEINNNLNAHFCYFPLLRNLSQLKCESTMFRPGVVSVNLPHATNLQSLDVYTYSQCYFPDRIPQNVTSLKAPWTVFDPQRFTHLHTLGLRDSYKTEIDEDYYLKIRDLYTLPFLTKLSLKGLILPHNCMEYLKSVSNLTHLNVSRTEGMDTNWLNEISALSKLVVLKMVAVVIQADGLRHLIHTPHLERLKVGSVRMEKTFLSRLVHLTRLRKLDLNSTYPEPNVLQHLSAFTSLTCLDLGGVYDLNQNTFENLCFVTRLKKLVFSAHSRFCNEAVFENLRHVPQLTSLQVTFNESFTTALQNLRFTPNLKKGRFIGAPEKCLDGLKWVTKLEVLTLNDSFMTPAMIIAYMKKNLPEFPRLRSFEIRGSEQGYFPVTVLKKTKKKEVSENEKAST